MAYVRKNLDEIVAGLPGVNAQVEKVANDRAERMKAIIEPHNKTWRLWESVKVKRAFKGKDYWIHVEAHYAIPINYGFDHNWTGEHVKGINFIKGAIYG
jgi:hypothetical protein